MNQEILIEGNIENIVYSNPENGYSVVDLNCEGKLVTAVGTMPSICAGEKVRLMGSWVNHPSFGRQFKADKCERTLPKTAGDMTRSKNSL